MADGTIGNEAIARPNNANAGYTTIVYQNAASKSGKLYKVDLFTSNIKAAPQSGKIKVFREVGANFVQVGSSYAITSALEGLNTYTLSTPIDVLVGDYIAWWTVPTNYIYCDITTTGGSCYFYNGDVSGTLAKASWTANAWIPSIYGYIKPPSAGGMGFGNPMIF